MDKLLLSTDHSILQKNIVTISNILLQMKYFRNNFVKYCKIDRNITILTFWNSFENNNKYYNNNFQKYCWKIPLKCAISIIFPNSANNKETLFSKYYISKTLCY